MFGVGSHEQKGPLGELTSGPGFIEEAGMVLGYTQLEGSGCREQEVGSPSGTPVNQKYQKLSSVPVCECAYYTVPWRGACAAEWDPQKNRVKHS